MTEKNALSELANELTWIEDILRSEGYDSYCDEANKAQRIVAELAKVVAIKRKLDSQMSTQPSDVWSKTMNKWVEADRRVVDRCRAIAEEGGEMKGVKDV